MNIRSYIHNLSGDEIHIFEDGHVGVTIRRDRDGNIKYQDFKLDPSCYKKENGWSEIKVSAIGLLKDIFGDHLERYTPPKIFYRGKI